MDRVEITGPGAPRYDEVLTEGALDLVTRLHDELDETRRYLLRRREERQAELDAGGTLDLVVPPEDFTVAPVPDAIQDRRVEITGPASRKMVINALNSGARAFMADFEDANSPYWANMAGGQVNLADAIRRTIEHHEDGRHYELDEETAVLLMRPRGLHLPERHLLLDGEPVAGAFVDFGLYMHRNAEELLRRGAGPFFYIPKLESHLEARLWRDAFVIAEDALGLDRGTIKATVLVETLPAAFAMDAILYELRDHSAGLNAGRWDYIFSAIKRFRSRPDFVLPDRSSVTMTVPFMRAYTELLVKTCHRRGAHAMGGMAAVIPSRRDPEINEAALAKVRDDKKREATDGFDGTWVAHPDTVSTAMEELDKVLGERPNQIERQRDDVDVSARELLDIEATPGDSTEEGLRNDVSVGIQYLSHWLLGQGAAGIFNMMEDAATSEIARSQVWQWRRHGVRLKEGPQVTSEFVRAVIDEELEKIREAVGDEIYAKSRPDDARVLFEQVAVNDELAEFLTLPAYDYI